MLNIWQQCKGNNHISRLQCNAWRIVENQTQTATRKLVDSWEEQQLLESIIDFHKPTLPENTQGFHYLLSTPFRYPPLKHGSRFGTKYDVSIWYGSLTIDTGLAEKAYYRFHFLKGSEGDFDELPIKYSAFQIEIITARGIDLTDLPFNSYAHEISKPHSYVNSQELGSEMRKANVDAFYYVSARCPQKGKNIGLFNTRGFKTKFPKEPFQTWQGTVINTKSEIEFIRTNGLQPESKQFSIELFKINGTLPSPAP